MIPIKSYFTLLHLYLLNENMFKVWFVSTNHIFLKLLLLRVHTVTWANFPYFRFMIQSIAKNVLILLLENKIVLKLFKIK